MRVISCAFADAASWSRPRLRENARSRRVTKCHARLLVEPQTDIRTSHQAVHTEHSGTTCLFPEGLGCRLMCHLDDALSTSVVKSIDCFVPIKTNKAHVLTKPLEYLLLQLLQLLWPLRFPPDPESPS